MNTMTKANTLRVVSMVTRAFRGHVDVQAHDAEGDDKVGVEDVGDTERKAEDDAQHSGPAEVSSCCDV